MSGCNPPFLDRRPDIKAPQNRYETVSQNYQPCWNTENIAKHRIRWRPEPRGDREIDPRADRIEPGQEQLRERDVDDREYHRGLQQRSAASMTDRAFKVLDRDVIQLGAMLFKDTRRLVDRLALQYEIIVGSTFCVPAPCRLADFRVLLDPIEVHPQSLNQSAGVFVPCGVVRSNVHEMERRQDRKSTRLNSSHVSISYAVFCLKKKTHYRKYPF